MIFNPNIQCHTFSFCELYKKTNGVRDLCGRWLEVSITTVSLIFVTPVPRQKQIPKKSLTNYRIKAKCNCSKRDSSISKNRPWVVEKIKQATVCLVSLVSGYFSKLKIIFVEDANHICQTRKLYLSTVWIKGAFQRSTSLFCLTCVRVFLQIANHICPNWQVYL